MGIKCFWLEPTDREKRYLRRYSSGSDCSGPMSYHDAMAFLDESREVMSGDGTHWVDSGQTAADFKDHPLWPARCACGYEFAATDDWQLFNSHIYRRADTSEEMTLRDAPTGAMWDATWFHGVPSWCGVDSHSHLARLSAQRGACPVLRSSSVQRVSIERVVEPTFRGTRRALFHLAENSFYLCDAWFEAGTPRMQIRSGAQTLEEAGQVAIAIQMGIDWVLEETARGGNIPTIRPEANHG
jgi:hypothetical protein